MLTHLSVQNFTLVDLLELELHRGMTAITGETGAGKSILLDALSLTLGDRADPDRVRAGRERADICATFDVSNIPRARQWLDQHDLDSETDCLLRRVVTREGRSRGYINGQPVPLAQLKELGEMLIDIHSQHAHQSLLKKETHRRLLDDYANHQALVQECKVRYREWQTAQKRFQEWRDNAEEITARAQLLRYQVQELDALDLTENELDDMEAEQRQLASADTLLHNSQLVTQICDNEESGLLTTLNKALHLLQALSDKPAALNSAEELLLSAQIQIQEAQSEISHHIDSFEMDPQRLSYIEDRLSSCYEIARKHRISPADLLQLHKDLATELEELGDSDGQLDELEALARACEDAYLSCANTLSSQRLKAAKQLQKAINLQLHDLAMKSAHLAITVDSNPAHSSPHGLDDIEFLISTNPGQTPKALAKVASGGELSRVSLAIQVVTAQSSTIPTLVFDEVDVGIGGATADVVGDLLRKLGQQGQVLCVTHLPQVASKGHQHLQVHKETDKQSAQTALINLNGDDKIMEIARMMGGAQMTKQTIAHAREMLEMAE
ncbi:DNA repair protein RecN [Aestuariicella hydrocarbonica]|uniref:DNA repair protein RecN n=1 Tax=Pseudomaricurvus hydrocarbonicus TaxID=1470433 RepID=A0A9E5MI67_9GAMM|nr:DNA repair protein RecN [Aestuariicella hydrocarbonica]NHO66921.1 DNA repair protein RecN [Aestuariicella hydrocarbonica]